MLALQEAGRVHNPEDILQARIDKKMWPIHIYEPVYVLCRFEVGDA